MRTCPYCAQPAMSIFRKANVGVLRVVKCQACGRRVSVSPMSLLGIVVAILGGVAAVHLGYPSGALAMGVGLIAMLLIHEWVPLVGRDV